MRPTGITGRPVLWTGLMRLKLPLWVALGLGSSPAVAFRLDDDRALAERAVELEPSVLSASRAFLRHAGQSMAGVAPARGRSPR